MRSAKYLVHRGASLEAKTEAGQTPRELTDKQELRDLLTPQVDIQWEQEDGSDDDST